MVNYFSCAVIAGWTGLFPLPRTTITVVTPGCPFSLSPVTTDDVFAVIAEEIAEESA